MSTITTKQTGLETRCPNCSAAVPFNPEDIIITCEYCGIIVTQKGEVVPNHFLLPNQLQQDELIEMIKSWLPSMSRIKKQDIGLASVRPMLIPYWAVRVKAQTHYVGYRRATDYREERRTRTVRDANGKEHQESYTEQIPVTVYQPVDAQINEDDRRVLLSRQGALFYGQYSVEEVLKKELPQAQKFELQTVSNMGKEVKFLSGEIGDSEAREMIMSQVRADHRAKAHSATTELFDCRTQVNTEDSYFIHYPFWLIEYTYQGKTYRIAMDGYKKNVLKGEVPVTLFARIISFILTLLVLGFGTLIVDLVDLQYGTGKTTSFPIITFIAGIVLFGLGIFFYARVYKIEGEKTSRAF